MRYWIISTLIHGLLISFVWVCFSVPVAREQNSFTYLGQSIIQTEGGQALDRSMKYSDEISVEKSSAAFFSPWIKMRELDKPR
jgi:hypothetical protein